MFKSNKYKKTQGSGTSLPSRSGAGATHRRPQLARQKLRPAIQFPAGAPSKFDRPKATLDRGELRRVARVVRGQEAAIGPLEPGEVAGNALGVAFFRTAQAFQPPVIETG